MNGGQNRRKPLQLSVTLAHQNVIAQLCTVPLWCGATIIKKYSNSHQAIAEDGGDLVWKLARPSTKRDSQPIWPICRGRAEQPLIAGDLLQTRCPVSQSIQPPSVELAHRPRYREITH